MHPTAIHRPRRTGVALLVTSLVLLELRPVPAAASGATVEYTDGRLSVRAELASRVAVLAAIAARTGAALHGEALQSDPLSIAFDDVPLQTALERLVGPQSFTIRYDEAGRAQAIDLLPGTTPARPGGAEESLQARTPLHPVASSPLDDGDLGGSLPQPPGDGVDAITAAIAHDDPAGFAKGMKDLYGDQTVDLLSGLATHGDTASHRRLAATALSTDVLFQPTQ